MWVELSADNGLHLYAETENDYEININFGYKDKPYTDLNSVAYNLFNQFTIKDNIIFIQDDNDRILATIHKDE